MATPWAKMAHVSIDWIYEGHKKVILDSMKDVEVSTCIRFVKRSVEKDFINIEPLDGCYSHIGRLQGNQEVSLAFECVNRGKGVVLHELLHVIGFWHEHSRADRDDYVIIRWKNIREGFDAQCCMIQTSEHEIEDLIQQFPGGLNLTSTVQDYMNNFCKQETTNMLVDYDLGSLLHYSSIAFSKNREITIEPRKTNVFIGQRVKLSNSDIARINKLYHCPQDIPSAGQRKDAVAQIQHWNIDKEQGRQTQVELNSKAANELTKTPEGGSSETAIPLVTTEVNSATEFTTGNSRAIRFNEDASPPIAGCSETNLNPLDFSGVAFTNSSMASTLSSSEALTTVSPPS
ncbi:unnamed protein product [Ranitomeya imitator]|uniref:Metalloendopeptidase n=1 Tax=Ranitomeya imitator TaxID=111125 RepID=A0ABN9KT75_9NEOB|nr:unnamed protein product [Ranitomeya imitator]